ncbi:ergothioneine biosynthesis protein EgtB [Burkholderiaceae bacterium UC74_6]
MDRMNDSRTALSRAYAEIRQATMALAAPLSPEDAQVQSMPDASPTKWHLAHVTWFFETFVLERFEAGFQPFDASFRVLFNSYYQGVGERYPRPQRGLITRPSLEEVRRYRSDVDGRMERAIAAHAGNSEFDALVRLGLQHEQQHQELILTDILHAFSFSAGRAAYAADPRRPVATPSALEWSRHEGGLVDHGHRADEDGAFCFDNELPLHKVYLQPFELASRPASNGEYLAFIEDGGYLRPDLWLSQGWDWVVQGRREAPLYWVGRERQHTLRGRVELDPHAPVCHLSYFEADAFARWSGARLPTEQEWEHAARRMKSSMRCGEVWEWTQSSYSAYPGFQILPGAVGEYNGKFMVNQYVLRGGSCATPAGHARASYRNFFPTDAQWQFSGVRLAR